MASRKLKVESIEINDHGLGSRALIVFNRNLNQLEREALENRIIKLVAESNQ